MKKLLVVLFLTGMCISVNAQNTMMDFDGNEYKTVKIGEQEWMSENLKTTRYNDGAGISLVTDSLDWIKLTTPGYSFLHNNEALYKNLYGALYNYYAVNTGKLCPAGWHIPSKDEWQVLLDYLSAKGYNYDGTTVSNKVAIALSEYDGWQYSTGMGCVGNDDYKDLHNRSGFSAKPAGFRFPMTPILGSFLYVTIRAAWWASDLFNTEVANVIQIENTNPSVQLSGNMFTAGYSCRCLKNSTTGVDENKSRMKLKIYPNPASNWLNFSSEQNGCEYFIINMLGQKISGGKLKDNMLNIENLKNGIYQLIVTGKNGQKSSALFSKQFTH